MQEEHISHAPCGTTPASASVLNSKVLVKMHTKYLKTKYQNGTQTNKNCELVQIDVFSFLNSDILK